MTPITELPAKLDAVLEFLYGADQLEGLWYGDDPKPQGKAPFWWRSKLRAAIAADREEQRRLGRLQGLEEAAKVCDLLMLGDSAAAQVDGEDCASAIRALKEKK